MVDESTFPDCLEISAKSDDGEIMAIRHKNYKVEGCSISPRSNLNGKRTTDDTEFLSKLDSVKND